MKIKQSNYIELETWIDDLIEYGVDDDYWEDEILEHFDNLPAKNNGNILAFMAASIRHFEVDSPGHSRF